MPGSETVALTGKQTGLAGQHGAAQTGSMRHDLAARATDYRPDGDIIQHGEELIVRRSAGLSMFHCFYPRAKLRGGDGPNSFMRRYNT